MSANVSNGLFDMMFDVKPIFCSLTRPRVNIENLNRTCLSYPAMTTFPKSSILSNHYDKNICSVNQHLHSKCLGTFGYIRPTYPDMPRSFRTSEPKRSIFTLKEKTKLIEPIFKENPTEYIQSPLTINNDSNNYVRHIGSQTIYREESTQTDPFSPIYTISGGEHPEVFTLSDFTYGKGLPATSLEISFIERIRARREWEQDRSIDMTRTKIFIEREKREWQLREKEIEMLEDARHKLFTTNLHHYIQTDEDVTHSIIDLSIYRQERQLEFRHQRLQTQATREIRRIKRMYRLREAQIDAVTRYNHFGVIGMAQRGNGCFSSLKPPWHTRPDDIITSYKDTISTIYTPCAYFDDAIGRRINQSGLDIFKLEAFIPKHALIAQIDPPERMKVFQKNSNKKSYRRVEDLERASQLIEEEKNKSLSTFEKKPLRFIEKIERIDHIPQLSPISTQTEAHDHRRMAIIKLQNYLRGIIVHSNISDVYQIRQDLLEELRSGLKDDQKSSFKQSDENENTNRLGSAHTQIYDYLEGATIGDMLDFLSKELLRLQCEQTIHLFIVLADRYRYQREAAEIGARTRSIEQQTLEDRALEEMFSLDYNSNVDACLEDLILQSISNTADQQARLEIQQITEILVKRTNHSSSNQSDIETIVADLVHNFLFPTVQRILIAEKARHEMK